MKPYISFSPYNKKFPELFSIEQQRIASFLCATLELKPVIEHIGSTAIPEMGGKGVIDIALACEKNRIEEAALLLPELNYTYSDIGSSADRKFFIAFLDDEDDNLRRYHLHVTFSECVEWKGLLGVRDYLRAHPAIARNYEELKKRAVVESNQDWLIYRKIKSPIIVHALSELGIDLSEVKINLSQSQK